MQYSFIEGNIKKWKENGWAITSPIVRKCIRDNIRSAKFSNKEIRHFLMGIGGRNSNFSAIQVSHVYFNDGNLEFRIYGWLPDKEPINGNVQNILKLLTQLFNDVPWKERYDSSQRKNVKLLPSQIEDGICWQNNNLELLGNKRNIKKLFLN